MRTFTVVKAEAVNCDCFVDMECLAGSEELRACRVCLATDTKLFNLHLYSLAQTFGDITGTPVSETDGLPQHVCATCGWLLQKCATFREKSWQSHGLLQEARVKMSTITTDYIRAMDRTDILLLTSTKTLTQNSLPATEEENNLNKTEIYEINVHEMKKESMAEVELSVDYSDLDEKFLPDLFENIDSGEVIETKSIKLEGEDIESYSLRSRRKARKKDTEVVKRKVKKKIAEKRTRKIEKETLEDVVECKPKKEQSKRMYNRKTEEDFVGFGETYNMEVVFLTREQQLQEVQSRKEADDYINSRFQCDLCYKSFMKESAYKKHMTTHDPETGTHACDICHTRFPIRHKLMKHLRRHRTHFICKLCGQISKDSSMAKMHFKWHEGFKYECKHCGKFFNKQSSYMNHVRENHSPVSCALCGASVAGTRGLSAHKAAEHSASFKCRQCGAAFHYEAALERHEQISGGQACDLYLKPCPECGEMFVSLPTLTEHLEKDHKNKIYRCEQCNTTYSSDRQLGLHWTRSHKGQRRRDERPRDERPRDERPRDGDYMCEVCAKSYPSETTLRYHQRVHTGERPFQCPMCPKRFRMKTNLQVHINTHTGARPYKCALCPEAFKSYSQKHKHRLLMHTKERRHKCHMCEKTYVVSFDLKMHIRTVHMKIPLPPRNRRRNRAPQLGAPISLPGMITVPTNINIPT